MVTKRGSVEADLAEGFADAETGVLCTPATQFQLCSVSKQFTAAAVMLLVESGRLDLGEPVARWLPEGAAQWRRVTLHQLLSHTAGVPHWHEVPGLDPAEPMNEVLVQVTMDREDTSTIADFEDGLAAIPEVRHAERLFGDPDYLVRVATTDLTAYQELRDRRLSALPGVQRLTSTIVMKRIVDDRPYPARPPSGATPRRRQSRD